MKSQETSSPNCHDFYYVKTAAFERHVGVPTIAQDVDVPIIAQNVDVSTIAPAGFEEFRDVK